MHSFGQSNQLLDRLYIQAGVNHHDATESGRQPNRGKVFLCIKAYLGQVRIDGKDTGSAEHQRIAVRRCTSGHFSSDITASTCTVVRDHRLAQTLRQLDTDGSCQHIGRTACHKRDDDADLLLGVVPQARRLREYSARSGQYSCAQRDDLTAARHAGGLIHRESRQI